MTQSDGKVVSSHVKDDYSRCHPSLAGRLFPDSSGKVIKIADGTCIGYEEFIDETLPASQLKNVIFIPGIPGCRFFTHPLVRRLGHLNGIRLIVLERPGIGLSDPNVSPQGTGTGVQVIGDFAATFEAFCDALGITSTALIGYSAGTPYALACACKCRQGLVHHAALVSSLAPPYPGIGSGMALFFRFGYWACSAWPWFVGKVVRSEAESARKTPLKGLRSMMAPYNSSKGDKQAMARPEVEVLFLESLLEMGSRFQDDVVLKDNLSVAKPWGFDLKDIQVPVAIWQGQEDVGCHTGMARHLEASIPNCHCTIVPGKGHMVWMEESVLTEVLQFLGVSNSGAEEGEAGTGHDGHVQLQAATS